MPNTIDAIPLFLAQAGSGGISSIEQAATGAPATGTAAGTATGTAAPGAATGGGGGASQGPGLGLILPFVAVMAIMLIFSSRTGRKEKKRQQQMLASLGKGDKIVTIGGQIGVIDQVREHEVVVRIDENSNTKARFTKASIQQVLESAKGGASSESDASGNGNIEIKTKGEKTLAAR